MIDIIQQYWRPFLWSDGYHLSGLAVTMWLLVLSIAFGFVVSIPLAVARVSKVKWLARSVWFYTYVFRGTPLYVQLLFFYTGMYSLDAVREVGFLNHFFREGYNCTILAFALNTCAYTTEIFAGEPFRFAFLLDGQAAAGVRYSVSKAWDVYSEPRYGAEGQTDAKGEASLTIEDPGVYVLEARYPAAAPGQAPAAKSYAYTLTFEVTR